MYDKIGISNNLRFNTSNIENIETTNFINKNISLDQNSATIFIQVSNYEMNIQGDADKYHQLELDNVAKGFISRAQKNDDWTKFQDRYGNGIIFHQILNRSVWLKLVINNLNSQTVNKINDAIYQQQLKTTDLVNLISQFPESNINFNPQVLALPNNTTNNKILPTTKLTLNNFSSYLKTLKINANNFNSNFYHNKHNGKYDTYDVNEWQTESINLKTDLLKYSFFDPEINDKVVYRHMIKKQPQLNQYYDEVFYLEQDNELIKESTKLLPYDIHFDNNNLYKNSITNFTWWSNNYESYFANMSYQNPALDNLIQDHNVDHFLAIVKKYHDDFYNNKTNQLIDWFYHSNLMISNMKLSQFYIVSITKLNDQKYRLTAVTNNDPNHNKVINIDLIQKSFKFKQDQNSETLWTPSMIYLQSQGSAKNLTFTMPNLTVTKNENYYQINGFDNSHQNSLTISTQYYNQLNYDDIYNHHQPLLSLNNKEQFSYENKF